MLLPQPYLRPHYFALNLFLTSPKCCASDSPKTQYHITPYTKAMNGFLLLSSKLIHTYSRIHWCRANCRSPAYSPELSYLNSILLQLKRVTLSSSTMTCYFLCLRFSLPSGSLNSISTCPLRSSLTSSEASSRHVSQTKMGSL